MSSKAYTAIFPYPSQVHMRRLNSWAQDYCWKFALATKNGRTSWVAIRENTMSAEQWTRHVAQILRTLGIDTRDLRLQLCSPEEASSFIRQTRSEPTRTVAANREAAPTTDPEAKIIDLSNTNVARRKGTGATKRKVTKIEVVRN